MQQRFPEQRDRLWVTGFSPQLPDSDLRQFCARFGTFVHLFRTKYKTDVFLKYMTEEDAALAMTKFNQDNITAKYAYDKLNRSSQPEENQRRVRFTNGNGGHQSDDAARQERLQKATIFRSGEDVIVTHVRENFFFYAYPKTKEQEYNQLLQAVSQSSEYADLLVGLPRKGDLVLACCNGDYLRALVINNVNSKQELVSVQIIDIGFTTKLEHQDLKVLPDKFSNVRLTYRFKLDDCVDDSTNSYAVECFKSFVGSMVKMETDDTIIKPLSAVKLIEPNTNENINELLKQMMPGKCFTIEDHIIEPPSIGANIELTVIDHTKLKEGYNGITFVEQKKNLEYYRQRNQTQTIAKILERFPPYLPREDELCFVKSNDFWYRGCFCEKSSDTTATVLVFDIEKGVEIELKNIRKITDGFVQEPHLLFTASLHGYSREISTEQAYGLMHKFKVGDDILVKSVYMDEDEKYEFKI